MYRVARKAARMSREEAAFRLHVGARTLANYEDGKSVPPPEVVLEMGKVYNNPWLPHRYCRMHCAIGKAYRYAILDNVNLDIASVLLKLVGELEEARAVQDRLMSLAVNKRGRQDFSEEEWREFVRCLHEYLDIEHTIEMLRLALEKWCDVSELVGQHNRKCRDRGYATEQENPLTRLMTG